MRGSLHIPFSCSSELPRDAQQREGKGLGERVSGGEEDCSHRPSDGSVA